MSAAFGKTVQLSLFTGQQFTFGLILTATKESGPHPELARLPNKNNNGLPGLHEQTHPLYPPKTEINRRVWFIWQKQTRLFTN
jgi:hypothetical protein